MTKRTPNDLAQHAAAQQRQKSQPSEIVENVTEAIQKVFDADGFEIHEPARQAIAKMFDWLDNRASKSDHEYGPVYWLTEARKEALGEKGNKE